MSPYAYAYRTCKHPCAYACVVRVNQAFLRCTHRQGIHFIALLSNVNKMNNTKMVNVLRLL